MISLLVAAVVAATSAPKHDACEWFNPGSDPYRAQGDVTRALADFGLSTADHALIQAKMDRGQFDDTVRVTPQGVDSDTRHEHYSQFRDMHSLHSTCHGPVKMKSWKPDHYELALLYCGTGSQCVVVPIVCANIGVVDRVVAQKEVDGSPIDIQPSAGPAPAPTEDQPVVTQAEQPQPQDQPNWPPVYDSGYYGGGGFYGGGGGGGGGGTPGNPGGPASGPGCGCKPPPPVCPPPISSVAEPASWMLLVISIFAMLSIRRFRRIRK